MSKVKECVACTYALKAKGKAKNTLVSYLKSEGFFLEAEKGRGIIDYVWFWIARLAVSGGVFAAVFVVRKIIDILCGFRLW